MRRAVGRGARGAAPTLSLTLSLSLSLSLTRTLTLTLTRTPTEALEEPLPGPWFVLALEVLDNLPHDKV